MRNGIVDLTRPIAFIENKTPNFAAIADLLARSAAENRWTNFGPVWLELQRALEDLLCLPPERCAVPCASGTHALMAAAALAERNGAARWLVPDYGFRATAIGPFDGATTVDCNRSGIVDAGVLVRIDPASYDCVVVINPFGLLGDMSDVVNLTREQGKFLIIDNAAGHLGFDRSDHGGILECLSFHHTKPFGFGEGGCLVVDRTLFEDARSALDFGYRWTWSGGGRAHSNGKLSDPAAAFILDRITRATEWAGEYRHQFARILKIAKEHGFNLLVDETRLANGIFGNVPLIAPKSVPIDALDNDLLVLAKYYKPIHGKSASTKIYERIVNIPCHTGVASLSNDEIELVFRRLARAT